MKKSIIFFVILATIATTTPAQVRQRSATKGFNAAAHVHVLGWASEYFENLDKNSSSGYGGGIRLGYGITELIEPYAAVNFTTLGTSKIDAQSFNMLHFDAGVRVNLAGTVHPVRPFLEAGYSYLKGKVNQVIIGPGSYADIEFYGGKPHVGGGVNYFFKIPIAVFAEGIFTVGKKSKAKLDGTEIPNEEPDVTTFRVNIGISFNISELSKK